MSPNARSRALAIGLSPLLAPRVGGLGGVELEHVVPGDPTTGRRHGIGGRRVCLGSFGGSTWALVYGVRRHDAEAGTVP